MMGCQSESSSPTDLPPQPAVGATAVESSPAPPAEWGLLTRDAARHGLPADALLLRISVANQQMQVIQTGRLLKAYPVSTSEAGIGNQQDSNRTPLGWHRVKERYGATAAPGQNFVSRRPSGDPLPPSQWRSARSEDRVLSRILRLEGLEAGVNQGPGIDSFQRCIYIHGTNQEQLLGHPASHGCIRMANRDVIELFDLAAGMQVGCVIVTE